MPKPIIDKAKCTVCEICIGICPVEVFSISKPSDETQEKKEIIISKPEECIGCRACEAQCPNSAIVVKD
jgi:NAD-dependent dihydropyrimidine dehydrogenase PreA subunit